MSFKARANYSLLNTAFLHSSGTPNKQTNNNADEMTEVLNCLPFVLYLISSFLLALSFFSEADSFGGELR